MQLNRVDPEGEIVSEGEKVPLKTGTGGGGGDGGENKEVIDEEVNNNNVHQHEAAIDRESVIAVLVFVCNRPTINRCLDSLFKYRPSAAKFPIVVSQDCGHHEATSTILRQYEDRITHIMVRIRAKSSKMLMD